MPAFGKKTSPLSGQDVPTTTKAIVSEKTRQFISLGTNRAVALDGISHYQELNGQLHIHLGRERVLVSISPSFALFHAAFVALHGEEVVIGKRHVGRTDVEIVSPAVTTTIGGPYLFTLTGLYSGNDIAVPFSSVHGYEMKHGEFLIHLASGRSLNTSADNIAAFLVAMHSVYGSPSEIRPKRPDSSDEPMRDYEPAMDYYSFLPRQG